MHTAIRRPLAFFIIGLVVLSTIGLPTQRARAADVFVTNTSDIGPGSLRHMITNVALPGDRVLFNLSGCPCTILLDSAIPFNKNLTIEGLTAASDIVIRPSTDHAHNIFSITGGSVVLKKLELRKGGGVVSGGAVYSTATSLVLEDMIFRYNRTESSTATSGGAVHQANRLIVQNSQFYDNYASSSANDAKGGAIYVAAASQPITVTASTFSHNGAGANSAFVSGTGYGGALYVESGNITIQNGTNFLNNNPGGNTSSKGGALFTTNGILSAPPGAVNTFSQNSAVAGGAVYVDNAGGSYTLNNIAFTNNAAIEGGALYSNPSNQSQISASLFSSNISQQNGAALWHGGATLNVSDVNFAANAANLQGIVYLDSGPVNINRSSFYANTHSGVNQNGAVIFVAGFARLSLGNSTISDNVFTNPSGGGAPVFNMGESTIIHSTIVRNAMRPGSMSAGGIRIQLGTLRLSNSIVGLNTVNFALNDISGTFVSEGHNLVQTRGSSVGYIGSDLPNGTLPRVAPLAENGGTTKTVALFPDSPAIDSADNIGCVASPINNADQRGVIRPIDGDGVGGVICDIGAFELTGKPILTLSLAAAYTAVDVPITLTHTISNPGLNSLLSSLAFTNELPPGLFVASDPMVTNTCGTPGQVVAAPGSNIITVSSAGVLLANCTISVKVVSRRAGTYNIQANGITALQTGGGSSSNIVALKVGDDPTVALSLSSPAVGVNAVTILTHTLRNPNPTLTLTNVAFTHTFTGELTATSPVNNCGTGSAGVSLNTLNVSGVTLTAGQTCTITVTVSNSGTGRFVLVTNPISTTETGSGDTSNRVTLNVILPPTVALNALPNTIYPGGVTRLEYTLYNPNSAQSLTDVLFSHTLTGVLVANPPAITNTCTTPGFITAPPGSSSVAVNGITLKPLQTCRVTVNVSGNTLGSFANQTEPIASFESGTGTASNIQNIAVSNSSVRVQLAASQQLVNVGTPFQITYAINNTAGASGTVSLTQNMPANVRIPIEANLQTTCPGTPIFTVNGTRSALTIANLGVNASSACTVSFNVLGIQAGRVRTGATNITSTLGVVVPSNEVLLDVVGNPGVTLDVVPRTLSVNNDTRVMLQFTNPNQNTLTGFALTYNLSGLLVAPVPDIVNTCDSGGTSISPGVSNVSVTGVTLNPAQACSVSFNARALPTPGTYINRTNAVSTSQTGTGTASNDVAVKVYAAPTVAVGLAPATIKTDGTTTITYTINNPNSAVTGLTGIAFVHDLPQGVTIASTPNVGGTCGSIGTAVTAAPNGNQIVVDGVTLAAAVASCTVTVSLTSGTTGEYAMKVEGFNTLQGGAGASNTPVTLRVARYDCTLSGLNTALTNGGNATFACNTTTTITLTGTTTITQDTVIDGNSLLQITTNFDDGPPRMRPRARDGRIFGAFQVGSGATLRISNVTFTSSDDPTIPPLGVTGNAILTNVTFTGNSLSGALLVYSGANVTIYNSTFANNTAVNNSEQSDGGAIYLEPNSTVNVFNSTFVNNSVSSSGFSQRGGAIYVASPATLNLTNVTFSGNNANGTGKTLYIESGADVTLTNTIITNSISGNCAGAVIDGGHNLQFPDNACGNSIPVANPLLNALGNNGGHTQTMSLQATSPALDAGNYNVCQTTLKNVDQRGYIRQTPATICDIGAFENGAQVPLLQIAAPASVPIGEPFNVTVTALDSSDNVVAGYPGHVTFTSTDTSATLPTAYTFQDNDNGVHTFPITLNQTGAFTITVTDAQNNATNITATSASIAVLHHPALELSFAPASISPNTLTTLRLALSNANTVALNQAGFVVTLPANINVADVPGITNTCGDGTVSAAAGSADVEISSVTLSGGETCLITVQITGTVGGSYQLQAAAIQTQETGFAPDGDPVILNVGAAAPTVTFTFVPDAVKVNNVSVLTYAIQNNDTGALSNLGFTHNLPSGLVVAEVPGVAVTCATAGTVTATAGSSTITVSGVGLTGAQNCTIQVNGTTNLQTGVFTTNVTGVTTAQTGATSAVSNSDSLTVSAGKRDTVGIYRPSEQKFYLKNSNTTGPADLSVIVGGLAPNANYKPVTGDWNGDQVDTVGLYNAATGVFLLSDSNVTGTINISFVLGNPGDAPLSGRWSPDMTIDGAGVYRPSNGILYLKKALTNGVSDYYAVMGNPSDVGITGDFNGDGIDTVGIYRPGESRFYLTNITPDGVTFAEFALLLGNANEDDPFTGDWVGQGRSGLGVFRRANGIVYLKNMMTGIFADNFLIYGIAGDVPVAGRWTSGATPPPQSGLNGVIVQTGGNGTGGGVNPVEGGDAD